MPNRRCAHCGRPATIQAVPFADLVSALRLTLRARERPLVGWAAIQAHLAAVGVVTREGLPPGTRTLRRWRAERRLPIGVEPRREGRVFTTTLLLAAWVLSDGFMALVPRLPHGPWLPHGRATGIPRPGPAARSDYPEPMGQAARPSDEETP